MSQHLVEFGPIDVPEGEYIGIMTFGWDDDNLTVDARNMQKSSSIAFFDTRSGTYPSISGVHNGTIEPSDNITVSKLYTYPCEGTGGHTKYARIYNESGTIAEANWNGYVEDWHNISFDSSFTLEEGETYNYTIHTGSYPQIIHKPSFNATGGKITCTDFEDANGKTYTDWIPAIRLE